MFTVTIIGSGRHIFVMSKKGGGNYGVVEIMVSILVNYIIE